MLSTSRSRFLDLDLDLAKTYLSCTGGRFLHSKVLINLCSMAIKLESHLYRSIFMLCPRFHSCYLHLYSVITRLCPSILNNQCKGCVFILLIDAKHQQTRDGIFDPEVLYAAPNEKTSSMKEHF